MYNSTEKRVERIIGEGLTDLVRGGAKGLEKESLRVAPDGGISQTGHPVSLGAALTNPYITTDYSEALIELITPPASVTSRNPAATSQGPRRTSQ